MAKDGKKKVTHAQRTGRRGEHLVADLVLDMGFIWHGTDSLEGGLDGFIELADIDGTLVSQYIACQSKAVIDGFESDDGKTFSFTPEAADLDYWLDMSGAVILVLSRPSTREAYTCRSRITSPTSIVARPARSSLTSNATPSPAKQRSCWS